MLLEKFFLLMKRESIRGAFTPLCPGLRENMKFGTVAAIYDSEATGKQVKKLPT